jgi:hypothetical protein
MINPLTFAISAISLRRHFEPPHGAVALGATGATGVVTVAGPAGPLGGVSMGSSVRSWWRKPWRNSKIFSVWYVKTDNISQLCCEVLNTSIFYEVCEGDIYIYMIYILYIYMFMNMISIFLKKY